MKNRSDCLKKLSFCIFSRIFLPESEEKARISALLHDITKEYDTKKQLQIFADFGIIVDNVSMQSPKVFHAHTAALLIPREYPEFADSEVISAVDKHTTGSAEMSVLDCIIYLADYIEPTRSYPDVEEMRAMAEGSLFDTLCECLGRTMILTIRSGSVTHPDTLMTWNALRMRAPVREGEVK